jgi:hypothetical protein
MLWLHLNPILVVVCGRRLSFSGAWAGPRKETIAPHGSHKTKHDTSILKSVVFFYWHKASRSKWPAGAALRPSRSPLAWRRNSRLSYFGRTAGEPHRPPPPPRARPNCLGSCPSTPSVVIEVLAGSTHFAHGWQNAIFLKNAVAGAGRPIERALWYAMDSRSGGGTFATKRA